VWAVAVRDAAVTGGAGTGDAVREGVMMEALRLFGLRDLQVVSVPIPDPGPGEVLVRVLAAGICGTDRHLYLGEFPSRPPVTLGHEFAGLIEATGPGVDLAVGTLVTCDPNIACGTCPACRRGRVNLCSNNRPIGVGQDGGFATYVRFPARQALPFPAGTDPRHAALAEPLSCCLHAVDRAAVRPGQRVAILGGGVIGLFCLQLAVQAGAEVLLVTRNPEKRALAARLGASVLAASVSEARQVWSEGADVVLECAGVAETVEAAPGLVAAGGRVVIVGVLPQGLTTRITPFDLLFREIDVITAFLNPFTQGRAVSMIAAGRLSLDPLITRTIDLATAAQVIALPAPSAEIRAIVVPSG
jgi:L-iditol 2-dehydrogenase